MAGLLDLITGGSSGNASTEEEEATQALQQLQTPTAAQLTLPQLQQYVQQGILTPEQAQAFTVNQNALAGTTAENAGLNEELGTLAGLQNIINQGGNDAEEQQQIQQIENTMGTQEAGANEAALNQAAQRGTANSGMTLASMLENNQNAATNANTNALGAAANAEQRQLGALSAAGTLGGQVQGQEYGADLNKANAANAIAQFNASQNQNVNLTNTAENNAAQAANLQEKQNLANANTGLVNTQLTSVPAAQQEAYEDALSKATGEAGALENQAQLSQTQGEQTAGVIGGTISALTPAASFMGSGITPQNMNNFGQVSGQNSGSPIQSESQLPGGAHGGEIVMKKGGMVPGTPRIPGVDTEVNDTVKARLTPHEIVIPQTIAQRRDPREIMNFIRSIPPAPVKGVHPKAALDHLRALNALHNEQEGR